ncbi:MAG: hypothetical protein LBQ47_08830 [Endomicrobium sp.]|jgi:hypothetical protein|nr:hypothetical protein [Endomicrobium sp.]
MLITPAFAGVVCASSVSKACFNSGIAGYYNALSDAAFKMVDFAVSGFITLETQNAPKKEKREKEDQTNASSDSAVIKTQSVLKTVKGAAHSGAYLPARVYDIKFIFTDSSYSLFSGWMILLMIMFILSVKKQDDIIAHFKYFSNNKHPVCRY